MSTFTNLLYHIVFSTKYRKPLINLAWQDELYGYIGGIVRNENGTLLNIGGVADHVHLLLKLRATVTISDLLRKVKANSSRWVNERSDMKQRFEWQTGYAAFSVSESQVNRLRDYIDNQAEHHQRTSFKDEFLALLDKHQIDFELKYLFEAES